MWDLSTLSCVKEEKTHTGRIATLSWNGNVLSTGSKDCSIKHTDVRTKNHISSFRWHTGEVCGLKWDKTGNRLLSGGDDNQVCLWDIRKGNEPVWTMHDFQGAVKALDWCPNDNSLFATGGGSTDRKIRVWSTKTNTCLNIADTGSQISGIVWSKSLNQIISSHGFIENDICIWRYPHLKKSSILLGHTSRVLHMAMSPDNSTLASTSADESMRFWKLPDFHSNGKTKFHDENIFSKLLK